MSPGRIEISGHGPGGSCPGTAPPGWISDEDREAIHWSRNNVPELYDALGIDPDAVRTVGK